MTIVAYHVAFVILLYADPGPPYDAHPKKMAFYYISLYVIPTTICYFIVLLSTIFLIYKLRINQQWRKKSATQSGKTSGKEDKLVKTIVAICTLFIICSFPNVSVFITQIIYPALNYSNPYLNNVLLIMFGVALNFQAISSSVNFFFYYRMSSKFNKTFSTLYGFNTNKRSGGQEGKASNWCVLRSRFDSSRGSDGVFFILNRLYVWFAMVYLAALLYRTLYNGLQWFTWLYHCMLYNGLRWFTWLCYCALFNGLRWFTWLYHCTLHNGLR